MNNSGKCLCGDVSFTVEGAPVRMAQCHCDDCRKTTGTGHIVQAFFPKDKVVITGTTSTYENTSDAGTTRTRHFCPNCGSRLFAENSKTPGAIGIAVGVFDNSEWFRPDVILYHTKRPQWDFINAEIETHDLM